MKTVTYSADQTTEQEMEEKFGTLLVEHDTSDDCMESASLFRSKDGKYVWLSANGCDSDYDGWILTEDELRRLAEKIYKDRYRETADALVAKWVIDNIGPWL